MKRLVFLAACAFVAWIGETGCSSAVSPPELLLEVPQTEMHGGQRIVHTLAMPAPNEVIKIELTQWLVDCSLSIRPSDGEHAVEVNSPGEQSRPDSLTLRVAGQGTYSIGVRPLASASIQGRYALRVWRLPIKSRMDRAALQGELLLTAAATQFAKSTEAGWREAMKLYSAAGQAFADAGMRAQAANAKLSASLVAFTKLSAWDVAARDARKALVELLAVEDLTSAALAARMTASALLELAPASQASSADDVERWRDCEKYFEQAFTLLRRIDDPVEYALTTNQYGILQFYRRRYDAARRAFVEAQERAHAENFTLGELKAAQNLAFLDYELGDLVRAAEGFDRVVTLLEATGDQTGLAVVLDNSAEAYFALGHPTESLQQYFRALGLHRASADAAGEARSLHGIGITYMVTGDNERALGFLLQALPLRESQNDYLGLVSTLLAIGAVQERRGEIPLARKFFQQAVSTANTPLEQARSLLALSRLELRMRRAAQARELADRVFTLDIPGAHPMLDQARLERGRAFLQLREYARAGADLESARARFAQSHAPIPETEALLALATLAETRGAVRDALLLLEQGIARIEQVRERAVNPELRARYLGSQAQAFETYTALLMKLAESATTDAERSVQTVLALLSADRVRARTLRDVRSTTVRAGRSTSVDRKARSLLDQIAVLNLQVDRLREREGVDPQILRAQEQQLRMMHAELDLLHSKESLPALESSFSTRDLHRLQQRLPAETSIVVYALGAQRGWAWVVRRDGVAAVQLPPRATVEKLAYAFHADESSILRSGVQSRRSGAELSRAVIEPILPHISADRILFALDGALHYVPLAALPSSSATYLAEKFEISVFGSLAQLADDRPAASADSARAKRDLLLVADPVFSGADLRVRRIADGASSTLPGNSAGLRVSSDSLPPLPGTAAEAQAIRALFPTTSTVALYGFDATRQRFLAEVAVGARIIHVATHASANSREPRLSYIALAGVDRTGGAINGALLTEEIANEGVDAELVTLSGCETHIGEQVFGEGLRGLSHAWILAGARTVVGSLWRVSDDATQVLMRDFYSQLARSRVRPSAALREAQLAAANGQRYAKPYNWAAFVPMVTSIDR